MSVVSASNKLDQLNLKPLDGTVFSNVFRKLLVLTGPAKVDFDDLLNKVKRDRCEASFKELFEHFYPRVLSYFQKGGVSAQKSSELAQEAMISVWHKASFFDSSKGSCGGWIFTIARNLKFDYFRSHQRDIMSVAAEDLYNLADDPTFQIDPKNVSTELREKIDLLPSEQREVIYAMYFEGYSHGEYAELKKIPLGTVKSRIRLALAQLKKGLEDL